MPQPLALSQLIRKTIGAELPHLRALDPVSATIRPKGTDSWSPKEELGHLIDSAANNHQRFVRASIDGEYRGPGYAQNAWVSRHGYQDMEWSAIVDFWMEYNEFLAMLVARIPESKLETKCFVGTGGAVPLWFLIEDYVLHMRHHIDHLLKRDFVTQYPAAATAGDI